MTAGSKAPTRARVLIADDDPHLLRMLEQQLLNEGYEVQARDNGRDALAVALEWGPHVALLDHFMPHMNGRDVCAHARAAGCAMRVIMLTTNTAVRQKVDSLDPGADDYVGKPFDMDELMARVRAQVRSASGLARHEAGRLVAKLQSKDESEWAEATHAIEKIGGKLAFRIIGPFDVLWQDVSIVRLFHRRQPRSLLKLLLWNHAQGESTDALMEALFPGRTLEAARRNLHVGMQRLRAALPSAVWQRPRRDHRPRLRAALAAGRHARPGAPRSSRPEDPSGPAPRGPRSRPRRAAGVCRMLYRRAVRG
ncbi:MAG: response regulator [Armatimonadetes bacterium]|nr:response regulator [Armatimonadota bacterium]